ncbi:MAG: cyclic nucleotide-binding domain-containing protein [Gammaproteobacteria bacterium]|nr:cyclic nucleotide-binding domain-containing protein [Gammaproteobacteria bacterium]MDH3467098.1 cyclic nucleotide-binding domain-containing protein [Gammaproteobacteria bacterium]
MIFYRGSVIQIHDGDAIITEGQANTALYVVLSGELHVSLPDRMGRVTGISLAARRPGECVGEYSFLDHRPASASVRANQPTELFKITHQAFEGLLGAHSDVARQVYRNLLVALVDRLRASNAELDLFRI